MTTNTLTPSGVVRLNSNRVSSIILSIRLRTSNCINLRVPPYRVAINSPAKPGEFLKIIITKSGSI